MEGRERKKRITDQLTKGRWLQTDKFKAWDAYLYLTSFLLRRAVDLELSLEKKRAIF